MRVLLGIAICALACRGPQRPALAPAGTLDGDEGAGDIAMASVKPGALLRVAMGGDDKTEAFAESKNRATEPEPAAYGGDSYGEYGGDPYGGVSYAGWAVPRFDYVGAIRTPKYTPVAGLTGALEGTITWTGAAPSKISTSCGALEPVPRLGPKNVVRGALVYIEHVSSGRQLPPVQRAAASRGVVVKQGCELVPAAQVVNAWTGRVAIHGDTSRVRVRVSGTGPGALFEVQEGGVIETALKGGVTRVEAEDGTIAAAWLVPVDSPYYTMTDDSGHYRLEELATGTYEITVWQAPAPTTRDGVATYGAPIVVKRTIRVEGARVARLDVTLR